MKKVVGCMVLMVVVSIANAQIWVTDSIKLETNRINDVFFSAASGQVKKEGNKNWFIALSTQAQTAGVYINAANGVVLYNPHKAFSQWSSLALADTAVSTIQYNDYTNWANGALNRGRNSSNLFDYGWGKYNLSAHTVYGDSIFIIRQASNYYKLRIDSVYGNNNYRITIAGLSVPIPDLGYTFQKAPKYTDRNFIYVNATTSGLVDTNREPANNTWDIMFTEYQDLITGVPYLIVGGLSNTKLKVEETTGTDPDVAYSDYTNYSYEDSTVNTIGYDWKVFNGTSYDYDTTQTYLIKSVTNDSIYQYRFKGYRKSDGYIAFEKRTVGTLIPTAIDNILVSGLSAYPNPTTNTLFITTDIKNSTQANLQIVDVTGKVWFTNKLIYKQGLNLSEVNVSSLPQGNYYVIITTNAGKASTAFIKQ
jgi:hypothetical protein